MKIRIKRPGREADPRIAALHTQIMHLYEQGQFKQALPLALQARDLVRRYVGEEHPDYAGSLRRLALLYYALGNYVAAEPLYRQALQIDQKALGEEHPAYAADLNSLAAVYAAVGNYVAAEPLYRQALHIDQEALGEDHPAYAEDLNSLAALYDAVGNYVAAEPLYRQALQIDQKALGEEHPDYARVLNNLAALYFAMGNRAAAESLYRQALEIRRKVLGEEHPDYPQSLNNLALLYRAMGNYAGAETLYRQALEIRRKVLGEEHPNYARSLNNLAGLHYAMGDYDAAEPLLRQALEIRRKALGEEHPDYARSLNSLGALYNTMGNYAAAEPLYRQALEIRRRVLGEEHPVYAISLNNLAELHRALGNYAAAEPLYGQALEIRRKMLGENHPDYAQSLYNLAALYTATNRAAEGLALMQEAASVDDRMIGQVFSSASEARRLAYVATLRGQLDAFLSLVVQYLGDSCEAQQLALALILRRKAIGIEALAAQRDAILGGRYPALQPKLQELTNWRSQIAAKTLAGPGPEGPQEHQRQLEEWTAHKERLEDELVRQIPEMDLAQKLRRADRQAVAQALPTGTALVEFVRFDVFDFKAVLARSEAQWQPARFLAFVLLAGRPDDVAMIDLGEAEPIERRIAEFRQAIAGARGLRPSVLQPGHLPEAKHAVSLRQAVFDPLLPALGGRRDLFLAPDGDLNRLPFEALPADNDRCLIDEYQFSYVAVGRDILRFGAESSGRPALPVVAADPDFDLSLKGGPLAVADTRVRWQRSRALNPLTVHFDPLPGTGVEGQRIAARLGVQPWLRDRALEARLKAAPSPSILHLATHGFFLEDQVTNSNQPAPIPDMLGGMAGSPWGRLAHGLENPLLRSGLALAGANAGLQGKLLPSEAEDGLLTAEDVSGLDLLGTQLVVLSACDTGLGVVQAGEGVLGLRRAFEQAGARTLIMSLWQVPDRQTQELMEDFYDRILRGEPCADALRAAQLAMKKRYPEPYHWGAFICQGDPGPLP